MEIDEKGINDYFKTLKTGEDGKKKLNFEDFKKLIFS
jgi:hypothetical protein